MKKIVLLSSFGLSAAASLFASIMLGNFIDKKLHTLPLFTLGLTILIFVLWIIRIVRWVKDIGREDNQKDQT